MRFWRFPGRWWCGWRTWCSGRVGSRLVGAAAWRWRPAGPTASTNLHRSATVSASRAASRSKTNLTVRNTEDRRADVWRVWFTAAGRLSHVSRVFSSQTTWLSVRASKCSATRSTAAFAPCRDASRMERGGRCCRTPTCWLWAPSRLCPPPAWCTAGTPSTTRRWRAAPASPGSSVSVTVTFRVIEADTWWSLLFISFWGKILHLLEVKTIESCVFFVQDVRLSVFEGDLARGEAETAKTPRPPANQSPGSRRWRFVLHSNHLYLNLCIKPCKNNQRCFTLKTCLCDVNITNCCIFCVYLSAHETVIWSLCGSGKSLPGGPGTTQQHNDILKMTAEFNPNCWLTFQASLELLFQGRVVLSIFMFLLTGSTDFSFIWNHMPLCVFLFKSWTCFPLRRMWWAAWRSAVRAAGSLTLKSSCSWISSSPSWSDRARQSTKSQTSASRRVSLFFLRLSCSLSFKGECVSV